MEVPNNICPICGSQSQTESKDYSNRYFVKCKKCGVYEITKEALSYCKSKSTEQSVNLVSYWIKTNQSKQLLYIDRRTLEYILETVKFPKPIEQADNLILWMGQKILPPGQDIKENFNNLISIIGAHNIGNVRYIISYLIDSQFIASSLDSSNNFQGHLTIEGWDRYDELQRLTSESTTAFMAMKFGIDDTDNLFKKILKPAVDETGFELRKLDDKAPAGLIDNRLRVEIRKAKFLIADLTHDNPGAYFESGFAEGLGKPVLYICEKSKFESDETHFDTNHHLTLKWDMENLDDFKDQLKATIRATFPEDAKMEDG